MADGAITADDPRVAQILSLIRSRNIDPTASSSSAAIPQAASQAAPAIPASQAPVLQQSLPQQLQQQQILQQQASAQQPPAPINMSAMQQAMQQAMPSQPPQLPAPDQPVAQGPGPVKQFLIRLGSHLASAGAGGQAALLANAGLPTPYEKQQTAAKLALQTQQQNSLEGLRQTQADLYSGRLDQLQSQLTPTVIPNDPKYGAFAGTTLPQSAASQVMQTMEGLAAKKDIQSGKNATELAKLEALGQKSPAFQHVAGMANGQNTFANYNPKTGQFTDQSGTPLPDFKPASKAMQGALGGFGPAFAAYHLYQSAINDNPQLLPVLAPMLQKIIAPDNPGAAQTFAALPNGQPQDQNGNPLGLRMPGAPTATTRNRGQFASEVLPTMQAAMGEVTKNADQLGPFMGRVSNLYTSKIGAYGPQYSALQTDLHNIATAWGRLHGNSVQTMNQFAEDLNSAKDPANLLAKLQRYQDQAAIYARGGRGVPVNPPSSATQAFTDGGTTYHIPAALVAAFKKDHPNAR